jgi:ABC-type uncharacterized transport system ATPase component
MPTNNFNYDLESVHNRLQDLLTVLQYDSEEVKTLSVYERIFINQQRGDLLVFKRYLLKEAKQHEVRFYQLSEALENKVAAIIDLVKYKKWKSNFNEN